MSYDPLPHGYYTERQCNACGEIMIEEPEDFPEDLKIYKSGSVLFFCSEPCVEEHYENSKD